MCYRPMVCVWLSELLGGSSELASPFSKVAVYITISVSNNNRRSVCYWPPDMLQQVQLKSSGKMPGYNDRLQGFGGYNSILLSIMHERPSDHNLVPDWSKSRLDLWVTRIFDLLMSTSAICHTAALLRHFVI